MNMEKVVKIFNNFSDCERHEIEYWKSVNPNEKLIMLESIRAMHMEISGGSKQGLQRVLRVIEHP